MSDIVTSQVFSDGEKGITATKMNNIVAGSVIQPAFYSAKPSTSTLDPTDVLLDLKGTGAYAQISGAQLINSVSASVTQNITPTIWSVRLRSFNAVGNPSFEVDQRNVGAVLANPATGTLVQDRWLYQKAGTFVASHAQTVTAANEVLVPTTNFAISRNFHRVTITTAQASLGASDNLTLVNQVEGPQFRELQYDVHSMSLLVRSSVGGLTFGLSVRDPSATTKSVVKLCTIASANTWTLLTYPNLPVFPAGNFSTAPGVLGHLVSICLAAGTTLTAPVNDTWQNGNFVGALGQANFAATLGATFDIAFVQHEPGNQCSTLIDCPFTQNYDACLRFYQKTYDYGTVSGTANIANGEVMAALTTSSTIGVGPLRFHRPMAKVPAIILFNPVTGTANAVRDSVGTEHTGAAANAIGSAGFGYVSFTTAVGPSYITYHYTADTAW